MEHKSKIKALGRSERVKVSTIGSVSRTSISVRRLVSRQALANSTYTVYRGIKYDNANCFSLLAATSSTGINNTP